MFLGPFAGASIRNFERSEFHTNDALENARLDQISQIFSLKKRPEIPKSSVGPSSTFGDNPDKAPLATNRSETVPQDAFDKIRA
ncbi:MAG: hypothetical protein Q4Q42_06700 [Planctomycetia bacterium]|nr:hypothetical protein [Planctomycetia bacterium]